jgi:hypothetical protein
MLGRVVDHVAALTKRGQVARSVVGRIMVQVRAGDIHPGEPNDRGDVRTGNPDAASPSVAPLAAIGIPPAPVTKMEDASPCGRRQCSHRPPARPNRIIFDSSGQSIG